ncbi:MAG TPA: hypothetical protein VN419_10890 [Humidesulfovibrio sp.]|uniref:hypothetical protein n=1 Tax=Humidesulfovibrio sp. TaxID=2910988 RepID=UPI002BFA4D20|nr:hypothetical protein [Humidesulfovibrio sp.]HWR04513.1 hypothetical protein [Humidesulfovibrio sp.]
MRHQQYSALARGIFGWLAERQVVEPGYDQGGIRDPLTGLVAGEHYSATHFALLGCLLDQADPDPARLPLIRAALEFHARTSGGEYAKGSWAYHWDFNNYAFAKSLVLLGDALPTAERARGLGVMRAWKENRHKTVNWLFMRAYNATLRRKLCGGLTDALRARYNLFLSLRCQLEDGCIEDVRHTSRPIQYHAFSTALLHQLYLLTGERRFLRRFLAGLEYLLPFVAPDGDFNYLGRGHEQIFGYGVALYVLEAGLPHAGGNAQRVDEAAERCLAHLSRYTTPEGCFPLVLNGHDNDRRYGWYDYHHLTVYNAFLGVWLAECARLKPVTPPPPSLAQAVPAHYGAQLFAPSGRLACDMPRYFLCLSAGEPGSRYYADCGLAFQHFWVKGFGDLISCPGGPGGPDGKGFADFYAREGDAAKNFFAPLGKRGGVWCSPVGGRGSLVQRGAGGYALTYEYPGGFSVNRLVTLAEDGVLLRDEVSFQDGQGFEEFRLVNLPLLQGGHTVEANVVVLQQGKVGVRITITMDIPGMLQTERLLSAKGDVRNLYFAVPVQGIDKQTAFVATTRFTIFDAAQPSPPL